VDLSDGQRPDSKPVWFGSTKTLDVTIGRLRQKLEQAGLPDRVVAVRGVGLRLEQTRHTD
jgi:DNA-binding response OmpR family regulator